MDKHNTLRERQEAEKEFFSHAKWPLESYIIDENIIPWNMREFTRLLVETAGGSNGLENKHVLDCGCGWGVLSVLLAKRGARVSGVDIAPACIEIAQRLVVENQVDEQVDVTVGTMEKLNFEDEQFDVIVGTRVLHHVDIELTGRELFRVLKKGGVGIFWECTYKNRIYIFLRWLWRKIPLVPRLGTEHEHPLTREEVGMLDEVFGGSLVIHHTPYVFFSYFAGMFTMSKLPFLSKLPLQAVLDVAGKLDTLLNRVFPFLKMSSIHGILVMKKK